jgi:N utilization substance protein B
MQALFSAQYDPAQSKTDARGRIQRGMDEVYGVYLYLLDYSRHLVRFAHQFDESQSGRYLPREDLKGAHAKLYTNPLFRQLNESRELEQALEKYRARFQGDQDLLRKIFQELRNDDEYNSYLRLADDTRLLHMDMLYYIINHFGRDYALFHQHLEELFPNWPDDRRLVMKMIRKTLRKMVFPEEGANGLLEPIAAAPDELRGFGVRLFEHTLKHHQGLDERVRYHLQRTDAESVPRVDFLLMMMGVCEFLYFPTVPASATINEYLDISKTYSTPNSKRLVNGVLQAAWDRIRSEGGVQKIDYQKSSFKMN